MKNYRVEACFKCSKDNAEDELEEQFLEFMKQNSFYDIHGPVVFKYFPLG